LIRRRVDARGQRSSLHLVSSYATLEKEEGSDLMNTKGTPPKDIDEYIGRFPADIREILEQIRTTIKKAAPDAAETIKYGMPTFTVEGNLVHFAAFKKHIGFFPPTKGDAEFKKEASFYEGEKGSLRFPLDAPIPYRLIGKAVRFRVEENLERAQGRRNKR
jgi:uncharacterized protein YdhG (YjbR/CyaY superfamily)